MSDVRFLVKLFPLVEAPLESLFKPFQGSFFIFPAGPPVYAEVTVGGRGLIV
jgi:hypothetical protein